MSRADEVKKRERVRQAHRELLTQAINNDDEAQADESYYVLNKTDLNKYAFDELHNNKEYTDALKRNILIKSGEEYEGDIKELIEDDFEHWNQVSNNITHGAYNMAETALNMSDEEKANNLLRFTVFDDTDAFGEGSRDFLEQAKDVVGAVLTDPVTYTLAGNVPKLAAKTAQSAIIKKLFMKEAQGATAATVLTGSALSGLNDLNAQGQRAILGGEGINPVQTATATALGGVTPTIGQYAGKAIGKVVRPITAPIEATKKAAGRVLSTKNIKTKMATNEAHNIGKGAIESANEQLGKIKKGELFDASHFEKISPESFVDMRKALSQKLIKDKAYVDWVIHNPEKINSLATYFPEYAPNIKNIQSLMKGLKTSKVDKKNIAGNLMKNFLVDTATGVPGASRIADKAKGVFDLDAIFRDGTRHKWFVNGLLNAYKNRGGRINTVWGNHIKKKYKLSDDELAQFQDYTWGLMTNVPSQAFFREKEKDFKEKGTTLSY